MPRPPGERRVPASRRSAGPGQSWVHHQVNSPRPCWMPRLCDSAPRLPSLQTRTASGSSAGTRSRSRPWRRCRRRRSLSAGRSAAACCRCSLATSDSRCWSPANRDKTGDERAVPSGYPAWWLQRAAHFVLRTPGMIERPPRWPGGHGRVPHEIYWCLDIASTRAPTPGVGGPSGVKPPLEMIP